MEKGKDYIKIEAIHDFMTKEYALEWSDRFIPTKERVDLFQTMLDLVKGKGRKDLKILELGIGPGYLALFILDNLQLSNYEGLDFSEHMLSIAADRLSDYQAFTDYTQVDLTTRDWPHQLVSAPHVVVSTWALHDLLSQDSIRHVYQCVYDLLDNEGMFVNGDFIKPEASVIEYEGGRLKPSVHLEMLREVGFASAECVKHFEEDLQHPTTFNNYACFYARK